MHALIYSADAAADRAFLRDVLGWPYVEDHPGWLIFRMPPGEIGVHPLAGPGDPERHELSLMCDDLAATMRELTGRGATFRGEVTERDFGVTVGLALPGGGTVLLYQPTHGTALDLP